MPINNLPLLSNEQQDRIYKYMKIKQIKEPKSDNKGIEIMNQCLHHYARCLNKMIFDHYMPYSGSGILIKPYKLPFVRRISKNKYYGRMLTTLNKNNFGDN